MPGLRPRRALIAASILALAVIGGRAAALAAAERALVARGLAWETRETTLSTASWRRIHGPGLEADAVHARLLPSPAVEIEAPDLDLASLSGSLSGGAGGEPGPGAGLLARLPVAVHDLRLRWGEDEIASQLSGPLLPSPDLRGPGVQVRRAAGAGGAERWAGELVRPLQAGGAGPDEASLSGTASLRFILEDQLQLELEIPDLRLREPTLAPGALGPLTLRARATVDRDGSFSAEGALNELPWSARGLIGLDPRQLDLSAKLGPAGLDEVVGLFGDQVPEAGADLRGELSLELNLSGPPWRWRAVPQASGLQAQGTSPAIEALRGGVFTWRAPSAEGQIKVRSTGEGSRGWVPLAQAGRFAAAVVAAEDAAFWSHPGYDLDAIQEALNAWSAGEERPRGGSTLTQQLAKNLFFDGDRTLLRKLRELCVAVELERRLGKARVLELYLNVVELGPDTYGVGPASQLYFLKSPGGLTWKEAAFLAAILPAPRTYYQTGLIEGRPPKARIERVIDNLVRLGKLDPTEAARVRTEPLRLIPPAG